MIIRVTALVALAACVVPAQGPVRYKAPPGPAYRTLFERARQWTFPLTLTTGRVVDEHDTVDHVDHATITCEVDDAHRIGDASVVHLICAKPYDDLLIRGTWVSGPAGLYHPAIPIDSPDDLATLGEDDLLITREAGERHHTHAEDLAQDTIETVAFGASWCVRDTVAADSNRREFTLCFDATGITGGTDLVVHGPSATWRGARFGAAPPDE